LRYAQNSLVAISRLPAERLSDVFLRVVEAGLESDYASFALGTFSFLLVCRRWNEVAVGFPQLWVGWIPGAVKAWHLFNSRSKDAPLFLTWRPQLPDLARKILTDTETPRGFVNSISMVMVKNSWVFSTRAPFRSPRQPGWTVPVPETTENTSLISSLRLSRNSRSLISRTSYPIPHPPSSRPPTSLP